MAYDVTGNIAPFHLLPFFVFVVLAFLRHLILSPPGKVRTMLMLLLVLLLKLLLKLLLVLLRLLVLTSVSLQAFSCLLDTEAVRTHKNPCCSLIISLSKSLLFTLK